MGTQMSTRPYFNSETLASCEVTAFERKAARIAGKTGTSIYSLEKSSVKPSQEIVKKNGREKSGG